MKPKLTIQQQAGAPERRRPFLVALIATCDRPRLLETRALPSIAAQSRLPDAVIVVDDSSLAANRRRNKEAVRAFGAQSGVPAICVANRREKGASGAWNTGALEAAARWNPERVQLAFLDDDDEWLPHHLADVDAAVRRSAADFAAPAHERRSGQESATIIPPAALNPRDFLTGNPGITGSFLIVRLSAFLRGGMHDEGLAACTDRDLCIRLALLPGLRWTPLLQTAAIQHADENRPRLSGFGDERRIAGLTRFAQKYRGWMTDAEYAAFSARAKTLFGWHEPPKETTAVSTSGGQEQPPAAAEPCKQDGAPAVSAGAGGEHSKAVERHGEGGARAIAADGRRELAASQPARLADAGAERIALVVGVIVDPKTGADGLWGDLLELAGDKRLSSLDVVVVPAAGSGRGTIERQLARRRAEGLRAFRVDFGKLRGLLRGVFPAAKGARPISVNRSIAQLCAAREASGYQNPVCWILDGDCRLFALSRDGRGVRRDRPDYVGEMLRLKKTGCAAAVGEITGAAPLPRAMTVRAQLADLFHLLARATKPGGGGPSFAAELPAVEAEGDYHHDCGGQRFVEAPAGFNPLPAGAGRDDLLRALPELIRRVLAGDSPTRPLLRGEAGTAQRGGNTLIFDLNAALRCPNGFAFGNLASLRRQDEAWRVLNRALFGREIGGEGDFAVMQVRTDDEPQAPDLARLTEDIAGRAFVRSLAQVVGRCRFASPQQLLAAIKGKAFATAVRREARTRMEELTASFFRVCGLAESMRAMLPTGPTSRAAAAALDEVARRFAPAAAKRLSRRVDKRLGEILAPAGRAGLPDFFRSYCLLAEADEAEWRRWRKGEREKNARVLMGRLFPQGRGFRLLGSGVEGTVFADGEVVFKVLHRWDSRPITEPQLLPSLVGKPSGAGLYPVLGWQSEGGDAILTLPFEKTAPYRGGCGAGITALLAEMRKHGVLHWNLHPRNLRRCGQRVRAIDYGQDLRAFTEKDFDLVARRLWLVCRWSFRPDLGRLMTASLKDARLPELHGYERLVEAAQRFAAGQRPQDDTVAEVLRGHPKRVLDFGCGKSSIALELAGRGLPVPARDPALETSVAQKPRVADAQTTASVDKRCQQESAGRALQVTAWDPAMEEAVAHRLRAAGVRVAASVDDLRGDEPFDCILLRHVLCEIRSDAELRKCLADVRGLIAPHGRLVVALCALDGLVRDTTCAENLFPRGADLEKKFFYRKRLRKYGTVRAHVHRPESRILREFARAGFAVVERREFTDIDLARFEPCGGVLQFRLKPLPPAPPVSLIVRACAMDADRLDSQVRHLIGQLGFPRGFGQVVLALDDRRGDFLRQHTAGDWRALVATAERLRARGWIDRIVVPPRQKSELRALNRRWLGLDCEATHTANGAPLACVFAAFDACRTPFALHIDADMLVGRTDRQHDYLGAMLQTMQERGATTMALDIPGADNAPARESKGVLPAARGAASRGVRDNPPAHESSGAPFRIEVRGALTDLRHLKRLRPLPNRLVRSASVLPEHCAADGAEASGPIADPQPELSWHRAFDRALAASRAVSERAAAGEAGQTRAQSAGGGVSLRGGDQRLFQVHPPNAFKERQDAWDSVCDRAEKGFFPLRQHRRTEWDGDSWIVPERSERFVFVVCGRDVSRGRIDRCLDSMLAQRRNDWGAVIIDDASRPGLAAYLRDRVGEHPKRFSHFLRRQSLGGLANLAFAARNFCADPQSVLVTLDLDDALLGEDVLDVLAEAYDGGADVTVGSMLRTDKEANYPVCFDNPRARRGGNVWQHLRSFRKHLFDAIPDSALRDRDGEYYRPAEDWAYMLPIVETAKHPVWIRRLLYLHEPGPKRDTAYRRTRKAMIARLLKASARKGQ